MKFSNDEVKLFAEANKVDFVRAYSEMEKISSGLPSKYTWTDAAREAALQARQSASHANDTVMPGEMGGSLETDTTPEQRSGGTPPSSSEAPSEKVRSRYIKIKALSDVHVQHATLNKKVGIAEGKAKAWRSKYNALAAEDYRNKVLDGSPETRRAKHIADSYNSAAIRYANDRDALMNTGNFTKKFIDDSISADSKNGSEKAVQEIDSGELDIMLNAEILAEAGFSEEEIAQILAEDTGDSGDVVEKFE